MPPVAATEQLALAAAAACAGIDATDKNSATASTAPREPARNRSTVIRIMCAFFFM
jgi:hypothetical protein